MARLTPAVIAGVPAVLTHPHNILKHLKETATERANALWFAANSAEIAEIPQGTPSGLLLNFEVHSKT